MTRLFSSLQFPKGTTGPLNEFTDNMLHPPSGNPAGTHWTNNRKMVYAILVGLGVARLRALGFFIF